VPDKMNIHQRMVEVRKTVSYVKKDGKNKFQNFDYVSSSSCLAAIRQGMNDYGVLLLPMVKTCKIEKWRENQKSVDFCTHLTLEFHWINVDAPEDRIVIDWFAQGIDSGEKGMGKALTYAEKYHVLKVFNIPTDDIDPDSAKAPAPAKRTRGAKANPPATAPVGDELSLASGKQMARLAELKGTLLLDIKQRDWIDQNWERLEGNAKLAGAVIGKAKKALQDAQTMPPPVDQLPEDTAAREPGQEG